MKYSNQELADKLAAFTALKYKFEDTFFEAINDQNPLAEREDYFDGAKKSILEAQQIVEALSEDHERFPEGLTALPANLKWQTNANFAVKRFSKVRREIMGTFH